MSASEHILALRAGRKPPFDSTPMGAVRKLLRACCDNTPHARPSASKAIEVWQALEADARATCCVVPWRGGSAIRAVDALGAAGPTTSETSAALASALASSPSSSWSKPGPPVSMNPVLSPTHCGDHGGRRTCFSGASEMSPSSICVAATSAETDSLRQPSVPQEQQPVTVTTATSESSSQPQPQPPAPREQRPPRVTKNFPSDEGPLLSTQGPPPITNAEPSWLRSSHNAGLKRSPCPVSPLLLTRENRESVTEWGEGTGNRPDVSIGDRRPRGLPLAPLRFGDSDTATTERATWQSTQSSGIVFSDAGGGAGAEIPTRLTL